MRYQTTGREALYGPSGELLSVLVSYNVFFLKKCRIQPPSMQLNNSSVESNRDDNGIKAEKAGYKKQQIKELQGIPKVQQRSSSS